MDDLNRNEAPQFKSGINGIHMQCNKNHTDCLIICCTAIKKTSISLVRNTMVYFELNK